MPRRKRTQISQETAAEARPIDIAVSTVFRTPSYISRLISSLRTDLRVRLIVGSLEMGHLADYRTSASIQIMPPEKPEWLAFKAAGVHHRAMWNYWRALKLGKSHRRARGLVIFEDDVVLARGWQDYLQAAMARIERHHGQDFVLSLYAAYRFEPDSKYAKYAAIYPATRFFGTQAVYYPDAVRREFAAFLRYYGVKKNTMPYDLLLKKFLIAAGIPLFNTCPSLAQHIGEVSTGLGRFHRAGQFKNSLVHPKPGHRKSFGSEK